MADNGIKVNEVDVAKYRNGDRVLIGCEKGIAHKAYEVDLRGRQYLLLGGSSFSDLKRQKVHDLELVFLEKTLLANPHTGPVWITEFLCIVYEIFEVGKRAILVVTECSLEILSANGEQIWRKSFDIITDHKVSEDRSSILVSEEYAGRETLVDLRGKLRNTENPST